MRRKGNKNLKTDIHCYLYFVAGSPRSPINMCCFRTNLTTSTTRQPFRTQRPTSNVPRPSCIPQRLATHDSFYPSAVDRQKCSVPHLASRHYGVVSSLFRNFFPSRRPVSPYIKYPSSQITSHCLCNPSGGLRNQPESWTFVIQTLAHGLIYFLFLFLFQFL